MKYTKPKRTFEDSGVVDPAESYQVQLENVVNSKNQDIKTMVDKGRYLSIFAPRQSGKTTFFEDFCQKLEKDSTYVSILLTFQDVSELNKIQFYEQIQNDIYEQLLQRLKSVHCDSLETD